MQPYRKGTKKHLRRIKKVIKPIQARNIVQIGADGVRRVRHSHTLFPAPAPIKSVVSTVIIEKKQNNTIEFKN